MPRTPRKTRPSNGRPLTPIDWEQVDRMLEAGCNGVECAAYFGVTNETFYERCIRDRGVVFSQYMAEKRSRGDNLLRQKQYQVAMKGDKTLLVWLGKNRLKQRDTPSEISVSEETLTNFSSLMSQLKQAQVSQPQDTPHPEADNETQ